MVLRSPPLRSRALSSGGWSWGARKEVQGKEGRGLRRAGAGVRGLRDAPPPRDFLLPLHPQLR
eukprot:1984312-Rhodomonas_salina.1